VILGRRISVVILDLFLLKSRLRRHETIRQGQCVFSSCKKSLKRRLIVPNSFQIAMETVTPKRFTFGEFELDVVRRSLYRDGEQVALNSRAFDLLLELVNSHGQIIGKEELLDRVWAGQFVEEGNLTVHISALRKIFGEKKDENKFIATVPGRGYSFVAEMARPDEDESLVVSQSVTRIVVEEEVDDDPPEAAQPQLTFQPTLLREQRRRRFVMAACAV